ncbi:MAG: hypothetical protein KC586_03755, partial [Myxococcales bacterium]|nr:hypothetical protein [Myxococcales bacterium]
TGAWDVRRKIKVPALVHQADAMAVFFLMISRPPRSTLLPLPTLAGRPLREDRNALRRRFVRGEPLTRDDVTNALGARR